MTIRSFLTYVVCAITFLCAGLDEAHAQETKCMQFKDHTVVCSGGSSQAEVAAAMLAYVPTGGALSDCAWGSDSSLTCKTGQAPPASNVTVEAAAPAQAAPAVPAGTAETAPRETAYAIPGQPYFINTYDLHGINTLPPPSPGYHWNCNSDMWGRRTCWVSEDPTAGEALLGTALAGFLIYEAIDHPCRGWCRRW